MAFVTKSMDSNNFGPKKTSHQLLAYKKKFIFKKFLEKSYIIKVVLYLSVNIHFYFIFLFVNSFNSYVFNFIFKPKMLMKIIKDSNCNFGEKAVFFGKFNAAQNFCRNLTFSL